MTQSEFRELAASLLYRPQDHAKVCADFINAFWRERGFDAEARAEGSKIVSNICNGFPTKRIA